MTIRELFREFAAARLRAKDAYTERLSLAREIVKVYWFSRSKKRIPTMDELISDKPDRPTGQQFADQLRMASRQYGYRLTESVN